MDSPGLFPIIGSVFAAIVGVILSAMVGMCLSKLTDIQNHLQELNGKFYVHVTDGSIHSSGFAKTEEQIKSLLNMVKIAHERLDRVENARNNPKE